MGVNKLAYKRPECECGVELSYTGNAFVILNVKSNGKLSKYRPYVSPKKGESSLWCRVCEHNYSVELDSKERIFRGALL
jgi:hypothetical protein